MNPKFRSPSYPEAPVPPPPWRTILFVTLALVLMVAVGIEYGPGLFDKYRGLVSPPPPPPELIPAHLVVLLDVSTSLTEADIRSGADVAFEYIKSEAFPPRGLFTVYVMDRDVERNYSESGSKGVARNRKERDQVDTALDRHRTAVVAKVDEYVKKHPKRSATCVMTALEALPHLWESAVLDQRVLFVSDMVEDCKGNGDPDTRDTTAQRIKTAAAASRKLPVLNGVEILAAVPPSQRRIPIEWVRRPWEDILLSRGARGFRIGVIQQLIPKTYTPLARQ